MITTLLTLPVSGPIKGAWWAMQQTIAAAEAELYDEGRIVQALRDLSAELDSGAISEQEHAEREAVLLEQLVEARARRQAEETR